MGAIKRYVIGLCSILTILLCTFVFSFADDAYQHEWYDGLELTATGADTAVLSGTTAGNYILVFDGADSSNPKLNGEAAGNNVLLSNLKPGFRVEVYESEEYYLDPPENQYEYTWSRELVGFDLDSGNNPFCTAPAKGSDGVIFLPPDSPFADIRFEIMLTDEKAVFSESGRYEGLAAGKYMARLAANGLYLASKWIEVEVPAVHKYTVSLSVTPDGAGEISAMVGDVEICSGDSFYPGTVIDVSIIPGENYDAEGIRKTVSGETTIKEMGAESQFTLGEKNMELCGVFVEKPRPSEPVPPEESPEPSPEPSESPSPDISPNPSSDPSPSVPPSVPPSAEPLRITVLLSAHEVSIPLSTDFVKYTYSIYAPDLMEEDISLFWTNDNSSVIKVMVDPSLREIYVSPKKEGTATIKAVAGEYEAGADVLVVHVYDDGKDYNQDFSSVRFTFLTNEGVWFYDAPSDFSVRCTGAGDMLSAVYVDDNYVPQSSGGRMNWSRSRTDDTSINFSREYFATLSAGTHYIKLAYSNGVSGTAKIYVTSRYAPAKTGDTSIMPYVLLLMISFGGLVITRKSLNTINIK